MKPILKEPLDEAAVTTAVRVYNAAHARLDEATEAERLASLDRRRAEDALRNARAELAKVLGLPEGQP